MRSRRTKRLYILAFLKTIMPDSQPRSLGQDEKDHIIKISSLSTKPAERQELLCWAVGKSQKIPEVATHFVWMEKEYKEWLLVDVLAYMDTIDDNNLKAKIRKSVHFKILCGEFTDEMISPSQEDDYPKRQVSKTVRVIEGETGEKPDTDRDKEERIIEESHEKSEEKPNESIHEISDRNIGDSISNEDFHGSSDRRHGNVEERLRRAKLFATGLLVAMAGVFILHRFFAVDYPGSELIIAFTGAALIGGLADWYAVTVLFRNPLYIPDKINIPNAAIIRKRKNEIGEELANFVCKKILTSEVIDEQLRDSKVTYRVGGWLQDKTNAQRLGSDVSKAIEWLLCNTDSGEIRGGLKRMLADAAQDIPVNKALAAIVDILSTNNNAQRIIDDLTQIIEQLIDRNRDVILEYFRKNLKERTGWFGKLIKILEGIRNTIGSSNILRIFGKFLEVNNPIYRIISGVLDLLPSLPKSDEEEKIALSDRAIENIYNMIEKECKQLLKNIRNNQDHQVRVEINKRLESWRENLKKDNSANKTYKYLMDQFLRNEVAQVFFKSLWGKTQETISIELQDEFSDIRKRIEREIQNIGRVLVDDDETREDIDRWIRESIVEIVIRYRSEISKTISDTIEKWNIDTFVEDIESQIGKDLQFIRINGTLIGGLIGVVIYLLTGFTH